MSLESVGSLRRMALDTALPFDGSSLWMEFSSQSIVKSQPTLNNFGLRGTRTRDLGGNVRGPITVSGTITMPMTRLVLDAWLYPILGTAEAANVFDVAETLPSVYLLLDLGFDIFTVSGVVVSRATLRGDQAQICTLSVDIEAENMVGGASWPGTLTQPFRDKPYFFADANQLTLLSVAREIFSFEITIDNQVSADQFGTSLTRTGQLLPQDRIITPRFTLSGESSNNDLLAHTLDGEAVTLQLVSANESGSQIDIALGRCHFPPANPTVDGKGLLRYQIEGIVGGYLHPGTGGHVPDIRITNAHA